MVSTLDKCTNYVNSLNAELCVVLNVKMPPKNNFGGIFTLNFILVISHKDICMQHLQQSPYPLALL